MFLPRRIHRPGGQDLVFRTEGGWVCVEVPLAGIHTVIVVE